MRTIDVTNGAREYATVKVTEKNGADLSGVAFTIGLGTYDTPPTTWQTPVATAFPSTGTALVSMLVTDTTPKGTNLVAWAKASDAPEVLPLRAGNENITIK